MYVYELPYIEKKMLCSILDSGNSYEELAAVHMQFDSMTIQKIRMELFRGHSPSEELLKLWGQRNHTVLELFILLSRMKQYQAMSTIKQFVDVKYHFLIKEGEPRLTEILGDLCLHHEKPKSEKILNVPRIVIETKENNESSVGNPNLLKPKSPLNQLRSKQLSASISSVAESAGGIPQIPYEDLKKSTNDWDKSTILGKGGYGTVFKGTWKCTKVAIKRIEQKENTQGYNDLQIKQSITELHCLNACRHDNVLPLYGYSIGGPQPCLVYQYMAGGSLDHRLHSTDPQKILQWPTRVTIATGVARGLQYLHTVGEKPLIHGDIKSANILLDHNDVPRIGDFGLAREGPQSDLGYIKISRIQGTRPYLPDEFVRSRKFSTKVDTYSFGVVLFEIATALSAYSDKRKNRFLTDFVVDYEGDVLELKDARLPGGQDVFKALIEIGKKCVSIKAKERPEMVRVLIDLETLSN